MSDEENGLGRGDRATLLTAAVSGLVLLATGFFQPPSGPTVGSATAAQIRTFVAAHSAGLKVGATAGMVAVIAVLVFTAALAQLARARVPDSMFPRLTEIAGIFISFVLFLDAAAIASPLLLPDLVNTELAKVDDATVVSWYGLTGFTHFLGDLKMALMALALTSFSLVGLRGRLLPRWLLWLGLAFGACGAFGTIGITAAVSPLYWFWFAGLFGWALWILLVSITLSLRWRRSGRAPLIPAATTP